MAERRLLPSYEGIGEGVCCTPVVVLKIVNLMHHLMTKSCAYCRPVICSFFMRERIVSTSTQVYSPHHTPPPPRSRPSQRYFYYPSPYPPRVYHHACPNPKPKLQTNKVLRLSVIDSKLSIALELIILPIIRSLLLNSHLLAIPPLLQPPLLSSFLQHSTQPAQAFLTISCRPSISTCVNRDPALFFKPMLS